MCTRAPTPGAVPIPLPGLGGAQPMRYQPLCRWPLGLLVALGVPAGGCERKPLLPATATGTPVVSVSKPVEREVTDYVDFTGQTQAKDSVDIRARVTGYLVS